MPPHLEMDFSPRNTVSHLLRVIKVNIEALNYGLKLIESNPELPERLKGDDDFFHIAINEPMPEDDLKHHLRHILIAKCFEDLIKGTLLSLCDAYTLLKYRKYLCEGGEFTSTGIQEKHRAIYKQSHGMSFPIIIKKVCDLLGSELIYTNEIITINKARNCFAHRSGIVYEEKDINDKEKNVLTVKWYKLSLIAKNPDGSQFNLSETRYTENEVKVRQTMKSTEKSFSPREILTFDYNEIVEMAITFHGFAQDLVQKQIDFLAQNPLERLVIST